MDGPAFWCECVHEHRIFVVRVALSVMSYRKVSSKSKEGAFWHESVHEGYVFVILIVQSVMSYCTKFSWVPYILVVDLCIRHLAVHTADVHGVESRVPVRPLVVHHGTVLARFSNLVVLCSALAQRCLADGASTSLECVGALGPCLEAGHCSVHCPHAGLSTFFFGCGRRDQEFIG